MRLPPPVKVPVCLLCFWLTSYRSSAPTTSSMGSSNFLDQVTELRETFYSLDYQFIIKGYNSGTTRWKRCLGKGMGMCSFHVLSEHATFPKSPRVHQPGRSLKSSCWIFMEASLHGHNWLNYWQLETDSMSSLSTLPGGQGIGLKIPAL